MSLVDEADRRRQAPVDGHAEFARRFVPEAVRARVAGCYASVGRFRVGESGKHRLLPLRCKQDLWCWRCAQVEEAKRVALQVRLLSGVSPDGVPWAYHAVFTSPPWVRPLLRSAAGLGAFRRAVARTIAECFGASTDRSSRAWWRLHGAIFNLHPFGDEDAGFPGWSPHLDVILSAWEFPAAGSLGLRRLSGAKTRDSPNWPVSFEETRSIWARHLAREVRAALRKPRVRLEFGGDVFLADEMCRSGSFAVDVRLVRPPGALGSVFRQGGRDVVGAVRYSARSHFRPGDVSLREEGGELVCVYAPRRGDGRVYRVPPAELVRGVSAIESELRGDKNVEYHGCFSRKVLPRVCAAGGIESPFKKKSGLRLLGKYWQAPRGGFDLVHRYDAAV